MTEPKASPDYITAEKVNALDLPQELKDCLNGLIQIRPRAEAMKRAPMWTRFVNVILLNLYKEHRAEWIKLFARHARQFEPVRGVYDPLNTVTPNTKKSDFVAQPCEGCNTKEMEAFAKTGKLPERMLKGKTVKDIVDARTTQDVIDYFRVGEKDDAKLMVKLKAYALSIGIEVHENTRKIEKVANMILDVIDKEREGK